jgi:hypothetical protein
LYDIFPGLKTVTLAIGGYRDEEDTAETLAVTRRPSSLGLHSFKAEIEEVGENFLEKNPHRALPVLKTLVIGRETILKHDLREIVYVDNELHCRKK